MSTKTAKATDIRIELLRALKTTTELERAVLKSALKSFGHTTKIQVPGLTKQQVGDVINSLITKGILTMRDDESSRFWFANPANTAEGSETAAVVDSYIETSAPPKVKSPTKKAANKKVTLNSAPTGKQVRQALAPTKKVEATGFMAVNHNGTALTDNVSEKVAGREAKAYTRATGNVAGVVPYKAKAPAPKAEAVTPVVEAPVVAPTPSQVTPPATIELVHEGTKGKRYTSKTEPGSKYHLRDRSEATKPVSIVRALCVANLNSTRKEVIELCIAAGVNKNTAATQYSLWKASFNSGAAVEE